MSSKTSTFENELLLLLFNNTTIANFADSYGLAGSTAAGALYISLHTASPGEDGTQETNEATFTGYGRVNKSRLDTWWSVSAGTVSPITEVSFQRCTTGSETITYMGIGTAETGPGNLLFYGEVTPNMLIGPGIRPYLKTSTLLTED